MVVSDDRIEAVPVLRGRRKAETSRMSREGKRVIETKRVVCCDETGYRCPFLVNPFGSLCRLNCPTEPDEHNLVSVISSGCVLIEIRVTNNHPFRPKEPRDENCPNSEEQAC